jgi:hypothetical protein
MGNTEKDIVTLVGKTYRNDDNSISLTIPKEITNKLDLDSKVMVSLLENSDGGRCLLISRLYREITIS